MTVAAVLVLGLAGCSSGEDEQPDPLPSDQALATYFDGVASYDPDRLADAAEVAADGSPAAGYVGYLADYSASAIAASQPVEAATAKEEGDGFTACGGTGAPDECVTWADLEGEGGELTDFTVDDVRLDDSLVDLTDQPPIAADGLYSVQPDYAYRSPMSGTLFVTVTITAGDVPVAPATATYIEQDQILDSTETRAPASVDAGASTPVLLAFPDAQDTSLDGQVTFDLGLGPAGTESIGFGLAAPAAG